MRYFWILLFSAVIAPLLALIVWQRTTIHRWAATALSLSAAHGEWRTPIVFYGKVIDGQGSPVPNAAIELSCNDFSASGTSNYHRNSDSNGLFSISRIKGKLLVITVTKDGYYTSRADNNAFYYAGQNVNFIPNSAKPELFHLRQIGMAEPLIHIQSPLGGGKDFRINKNGDPVEVSLTSGQKVKPGRGDLRVECWTEEPKNGWKFDWRCRITVINGGIQQYTNEFPFLAPVSGYAATDEIKMPVSLGEQWGLGAKRNYFLVLSNGNYARMTFEMIAHGDHFFEMESLLNPSGSRNLEFDGNKVIQSAN
jgi:hypothetical protein